MDARKAAKLGLGVAVSVVFIWLIFRNTDGEAFWGALVSAKPSWIALAVAFFCAGYVCRIMRWRSMLHKSGASDVTFQAAAVPFLVSIAANNVLPFRAGDVMRVLAFSTWLGVGKLSVLATMVVERLLDLLCLLTVFGLALLLLDRTTGAAAGSMIGLGAGGVLLIATGVLAVLLFPQAFKWIALRLFGLVFAPDHAVPMRLISFFETLQAQASGSQMTKLVGWSALAWAFEGSVFYAVARALPALTESLAGLLAFPIATLATLLPSTPGYAGTFHYFAIWAAELMGNPVAAATAFAVIVHMVLWLTATLAGGVCALIWLSKSTPSERKGASPHSESTT